ncbi:MAG: phenylalanine--tRNA ligase subunit beta [Candidatus Pacearchaeota archaeon]
MANIIIPKSELKKLVKSDEELIEKINLMGTPVESVSDAAIEIQILPNRADCLSRQGFLRAFKAYLGKEIDFKKYKIRSSGLKIIVDKSVEGIRPYSMAAIVKGLSFTDEMIADIMQWQERIHATIGRNRKKVALGYYVLNKIKFPIRYEAKLPKEIVFEPLEMSEKMNANQILAKHPCGREFGKQLEKFDKYPVYYDANNEILSMPPIINSNNSGKITPETKDVLIECSGTDLPTLKKVIAMAVMDLIDEGGKAYSIDVIYGNKKEFVDLKYEKMSFSLDNANKLLGLKLKEKDLEKLLQRMGYEYKSGKVFVPAWRTDILHEVDIIEDIAIAYGYNNLAPEIPKVATIGEESKESKIKDKISEILIGLGLIETVSYHLIKAEEADKAKLDENEKIELENSKTEYKFLRPNLTIPILRIFTENKDNEYPQRIFEIGTIFKKDISNTTETGIKESEHLIIALSPGNFTDIKQILDYLASMLDIKYVLKDFKKTMLIEGRTGVIIFNNHQIGQIGELHPETLRDWNIKQPVALLEISLDEIFKSLN